MFVAFNRPDPRALRLNVAAAIIGALLVNALVFGLGWDEKTRRAGPEASFAPPGWVVGAVWTLVLLPLAAAARWRLNALTPQPDILRLRAGVTLLVVACLLWPFYSLALGNRLGGLLGNLGIVALAGVLVVRLWPWSPPAALAVAPMVAWLLFATAIILRELGWL